MAKRAKYGAERWAEIVATRRGARWESILRRAAEGDTDMQIAATLFYSFDTIRAEWKEIRLELGAANKTHAVAIAMRRGMID